MVSWAPTFFAVIFHTFNISAFIMFPYVLFIQPLIIIMVSFRIPNLSLPYFLWKNFISELKIIGFFLITFSKPNIINIYITCGGKIGVLSSLLTRKGLIGSA